MKANKHRTFCIEGRIAISVGIKISAKSLEEAHTKAAGMGLYDFIDILGDHNDSNFRVGGVYEASALPEV